jgi:DNA-binding transcriptional LysR family regulator
VRRGLRLLASTLEPRSFEPSSAERSFVIAASDYVEFLVLPALLRRLEREAPGVRIQVVPWGLHEVPASLARGEVDLMIGFYDAVPKHHLELELFHDKYVCIVRQDHPRVRRRLTLERYLDQGHVLVSQRKDSPGSVDRALAALGKRRRVVARVSHLLMVPVLVARTDLIAALSARVAEPFLAAFGLRSFAPPLALPESTIGQVWHEQLDADPGHRWLRSVIAEVCAAL